MNGGEKCSRMALITGANKGLGLETARRLGAMGYTVWIGARDAALGVKAASSLAAGGVDARLVELDVTLPGTIERAAELIGERSGRLDALINNAGILLDNDRPSRLNPELLKRTFDTNVVGVHAVTSSMLPLIRLSAAGRIVNVSSSLGSLTLGSDPEFELAAFRMLAYNTSKTAVNALTVQWAYDLRDTPIKVNSADPGYMATDMTGHRGPRTVGQGAAVVVRLATLPEDGPTGRFYGEQGDIPW